MAGSAETRRQETLDRENSGPAGATAKGGKDPKEHRLQTGMKNLDGKKGEASGWTCL